jgi:hypothetical protein
MFDATLKLAATESTWVRWLLGTDRRANRTRGFLEASFSHLEPDEQSRWTKHMKGDEASIVSAIHELVSVELLRRLRLRPRYEPKGFGRKPDISFAHSGQGFWAEVYTTQSPQEDVIKMSRRAENLEGRLASKAKDYEQFDKPLVLIVFRSDHYAPSLANVEEALFGPYWAQRRFTKRDLTRLPPVSGLYLRKIQDTPYPRNLSAVMACHWFDSVDPTDSARLLECIVIHNWDHCTTKLPTAAFGDLPQALWLESGPDIWEWEYMNSGTCVTEFPLEGGLVSRSYSVDECLARRYAEPASHESSSQ